MNYDLYYKAIDADKEFHAALVAVYGEKNAGTMRYWEAAHNHPEVKEAHQTWRVAMDAWMEEMRANRGEAS